MVTTWKCGCPTMFLTAFKCLVLTVVRQLHFEVQRTMFPQGSVRIVVGQPHFPNYLIQTMVRQLCSLQILLEPQWLEPSVIVLVLAFTPSSGLNPWHSRTMAHSCSLAKQLSCLTGHMVRHVPVTWSGACSVTWPWLITSDDSSCGRSLSPLSISHTFDWLPHIPLTPLCPATLLVGCSYSYRPPHFWLDATLSFSSPRSAPATLVTRPPHSFFLFLFIPLLSSIYKHGLCAHLVAI